MIIYLPYILFFIFVIIFVFKLIGPLLLGSPFVPSSDERLDKMIKLANVKPGEKVADLGSGDGKIVIALAQKGAVAYGYEVNPYLAWKSRWKIKRLGLEKNAKIIMKDFWKEDFSSFDLITLYCLPYVMKGLEKKLKTELKPGARIVSNHFTFPNWKPKIVEGETKLYLKS